MKQDYEGGAERGGGAQGFYQTPGIVIQNVRDVATGHYDNSFTAKLLAAKPIADVGIVEDIA